MAAVLSACAGLATGSVEEDDASDGGIRYYQPAMYLLLYTDNEGSVTPKWLVLPDLQQKMSIRPYAIASSNKTKLTFTKGMLDTARSEVDQTALPKAAIASLEKAAAAAIKGGAFLAPGEQAHEVPAPYLFKLVNDGDEWQLIGGQGEGGDGKPLRINIKVSNPAQ